MQIYLLEAENTDLYKIGVSKDSKKRIKQIQTGCPYKLKIAKTFDSKYAFKIETSIHKRIRSNQTHEYEGHDIQGEWFILESETVESFDAWCESAHKGFLALDSSNNPFF